jgi:predicted RNase H-like HicB family nuclease
MAYFVGILDGSGKVWGVRVPDLPGVHGGGKTPEDAIADAVKAAREWAAHQTTHGFQIPAPRSAQEIKADVSVELDQAAGESLVMIPLVIDSGRPVKANISLDAGQLEAIDAEAARRGLTRSAFLATAALELIARS